jgi:coenzyme F420-reducing hydrogenase alpha subunit
VEVMNASKKIDILTRVEGHGRVELVRQGERVVSARLNLFESPRLFEALLVGKHYEEVAAIACRICSICSTVHKVAALQAVEQALTVQVSPQTGLLRQLAVQGGQIESHALHIFCLALPDYLGVAGFPALATAAPEKLQLGLRIKALGNLIQETVGGRAIHPFNLLLGGLGKVPPADQLERLAEQLASVHDEIRAVIAYISGLTEELPALPTLPPLAVSGEPPLFGDGLVTSGGATIPAAAAASWLHEQIELHSNAKVSRFDGTSLFFVGPLARLQLAMPSEFKEWLAGAPISASLLARAVELHSAVVRATAIICQLLDAGLSPEARLQIAPAAGEGVALIEAPRGALLHSYRFDDSGICTAATIITPTAINQAAIATSLNALITAMDGASYEQIKSSCERLVRCFDPCISCAVH